MHDQNESGLLWFYSRHGYWPSKKELDANEVPITNQGNKPELKKGESTHKEGYHGKKSHSL